MEELSDPFLDDRVMKNVAPPPRFPLEHQKLFPKKNLPDWKVLKSHLTKEGHLAKPDIIELTNLFRDIIKNEPNIVKLNDPVTIVGDLHGQYYDLLKCLEVGGNPENTKYLFLGDYVDRGSFSVEIVLLLISFNLFFELRIFLNKFFSFSPSNSSSIFFFNLILVLFLSFLKSKFIFIIKFR